MKIPGKIHFDKIFRPRPAVFLFLLIFIFQETRGDPPPVILALGDSLTAGYGVPEQESYPSRLQVILKNKGYNYVIINAGVSGDTTAGGLHRLPWLLQHKPKIVILALGANDGFRGLLVSQMYSNLKQIIQLCQEEKAVVLLAGIKIPPNYGEEYSRQFEDVFVQLAKEYKLRFIPFLLDGVAAKREFTQPDGIHPLGSGYEVVAETVWKKLRPLLQKGK